MKTIALLGQSLNSDMTTLSLSPPIPHIDTSMWSTSWVAPTGNGAITLCNKLQAELCEPIRLIQAAVGGSALCAISATPDTTKYWLNTAIGKPLDAFFSQCAAANVVPDVLVWNQGQQDYFSTDYNGYYNGLTALYAAILTHFGVPSTQLPIIVMICNKAAIGGDFNSSPVRQAQMDWCAATAGAYLGAATYDLPRPDGTHLSAAGYEVQAKREAVAVLNAFGLSRYKYRGPKIVSAQRGGTNKIVLSIDLQGADALWPSNPYNYLTGFKVMNAAKTAEIAINRAFIQSPIWIMLDMAATVPSGCWVRYQYGNSSPETYFPSSNSNPLGDAYGLPLQPVTNLLIS